MATSPDRTLTRLRNTRDLRAEILLLAANLAESAGKARLTVRNPMISQATVREEWDRMLKAIVPEIRDRMRLAIESEADDSPGPKHSPGEFWHFQHLIKDRVRIQRPNYRFEVLRLLLDAHLTRTKPPSLGQLIGTIGASQTPIRDGIAELKRAGVLAPWNTGVHVNMEMLSQELLARVRALPQVLRFRYERGAVPKSHVLLAERATDLLRNRSSNGWRIFALSGIPIAQKHVPEIDLIGTPRLDLTAHVPRGSTEFDAAWLRQLDDGLELEPSVLATAPVVVTLVRADSHFTREDVASHDEQACPADVFMSLLDMGLREQALQYARAAA